MANNSNIMSLTKEQIIKYIDELFLCVRKADWNCCHPDKDYTTWNLLSYPEENSKIIQDSLKQQILENKRIVERLRNDYKLYKDGFSTLEGWVMVNPELREAVDKFLESILKESQS